MPELPEVETIRRSLAPHLTGAVLRELRIFHPVVFSRHDDRRLAPWRLVALRRRGKYLIIDLADPESGEPGALLLIHFRMTGKLLCLAEGTPPAKHTHIRFSLTRDGKPFCLDFNDVRRFGRVSLLPPFAETLDPGLASLGPEPLSDDWTLDRFLEQMRRHARTTVKALLLNQTVVAGVGNIYCDEALFRSGIHPARRVNTLSDEEARLLRDAVRHVLAEGIGHRGTTFRDYVDGLGARGFFQQELQVFRREGKPCRTCGTVIEKLTVAGRGTHVCPVCQPLGDGTSHN